MRKICILFVIFAGSLVAGAQTISPWLWARDPSSVACTSLVHGSCVDPQGNVIVTGVFSGWSVGFGSVILNNTSSNAMFLVKYDPNGNVLWAKASGGGAQSRGVGRAVACDANGNIYVAGEMGGSSIAFGSVTLLNNDASGSSIDLFIAKYDNAGNEVWARNAGSSQALSDEYAYSICTDPAGDVYIGGEFFCEWITLGSDTIHNINYTPTYTECMGYVAKYDSGGNEIWVQDFLAPNGTFIHSVSSDPSGNILVAGMFTGDSLQVDGLYAMNSMNMSCKVIVAKMDPNGNTIWLRTSYGWNSVAMDICSDPYGNVIVTGYYSLGFSVFGMTSLGHVGWDDMFVVKYDSSGTVLWAKAGVSGSNEWGCSVDADASGNIYVGGAFFNTINFGQSVMGTNPGGPDYPMFVVTYKPSGNINCMDVLACNGYMYRRDMVAVDRTTGHAYISGAFVPDPMIIGSDTLDNDQAQDAFVAKYKCGLFGVGTVENESEESYTVYPNPATRMVTVTGAHALQQVQLYNVLGELVYSRRESASVISIDVSELDAGIYVLVITGATGTSSQKIVVE